MSVNNEGKRFWIQLVASFVGPAVIAIIFIFTIVLNWNNEIKSDIRRIEDIVMENRVEIGKLTVEVRHLIELQRSAKQIAGN